MLSSNEYRPAVKSVGKGDEKGMKQQHSGYVRVYRAFSARANLGRMIALHAWRMLAWRPSVVHACPSFCRRGVCLPLHAHSRQADRVWPAIDKGCICKRHTRLNPRLGRRTSRALAGVTPKCVMTPPSLSSLRSSKQRAMQACVKYHAPCKPYHRGACACMRIVHAVGR